MADDSNKTQLESVELLSLGDLSRLAGIPRSTIQFYIREGVLPPPQRLPNGRPIYGRVHAELLERIARLKAEGKTLRQICGILGNRGDSASFYQVDAAEAIRSATRAKILDAAADQFAMNGYNRTRLSDIIRQAGVSPKVFSSYFPSKKELFAESFGVSSQRVVDTAIPAMQAQKDVRRKLLVRFINLLRTQVPDRTFRALARAEALYEGGEPAANAQQVYKTMSALHVVELAGIRAKRADPGPQVSDELVAYCLLGAEEYLMMRLGWDEAFSVEDALRAYLLVVSAVHSEYVDTCDDDDWPDLLKGLVE